MDVRIPGGVLTVGRDFNVGDQAPNGYLDWHEWAAVQHKAGLRQEECCKCSRWKYPQELSEQKVKWVAHKRNGREVTGFHSVCNECAEKPRTPETGDGHE